MEPLYDAISNWVICRGADMLGSQQLSDIPPEHRLELSSLIGSHC